MAPQGWLGAIRRGRQLAADIIADKQGQGCCCTALTWQGGPLLLLRPLPLPCLQSLSLLPLLLLLLPLLSLLPLLCLLPLLLLVPLLCLLLLSPFWYATKCAHRFRHVPTVSVRERKPCGKRSRPRPGGAAHDGDSHWHAPTPTAGASEYGGCK